MKISAIGVTTFWNKQQVAKKAAAGLFAVAGSALAADTFVKGISRPDKTIESRKTEDIIKGNDDGANPCDSCCDDMCDTPAAQREDDSCDC